MAITFVELVAKLMMNPNVGVTNIRQTLKMNIAMKGNVTFA